MSDQVVLEKMGRAQRAIGWVCYSLGKNLFHLIAKVVWRITVEGTEHVPASGVYVVAPVHRSFMDFIVASLVTPRHMGFMGKDSLFKKPAFRWVINGMGAFAVHRGTADRESLKVCEAYLDAGKPLVMFPEGTRKSGPVVEDLFDGVAFVAGRAGVPIVPVGIGGSEHAMPKGSKLPKRGKIHVVVGPPITVERPADAARLPRRAVREATERLTADLQTLFDQAQKVAGAS